MGVWLFAIYALAVARVTGLVTADTITEPIRAGIIQRLAAAVVTPNTQKLAAVAEFLAPSAPKPLLNVSTSDLIDLLREERRGRWAVAKLITCQWCASVWIAAAAAPLVWWYGHNLWILVPATALAASQLTGMLSDLGRQE